MNQVAKLVARLVARPDAVFAYRKLRGFPDDWKVDWRDLEWNWFKMGWDAHAMALMKLAKEKEEESA